MNTYEAYKNKEFDLSAFGLNHCGGDYRYFCTPVGADVFASPGVDGIHYCMIEGFGEFDENHQPSDRTFLDFVQNTFSQVNMVCETKLKCFLK